MCDRLTRNCVPLVVSVPNVRIDDKSGVGATERDPVLITDRFMRGLGTNG